MNVAYKGNIEKRYDRIHRYVTRTGHEGMCRIRMFENRWNTVVIATEMTEGIYSSITIFAEELATMICRDLNIDAKRLIWVEHVPANTEKRRDELFDLVHFKEHDGAMYSPRWVPLTNAEVDVLVNEPLSASA